MLLIRTGIVELIQLLYDNPWLAILLGVLLVAGIGLWIRQQMQESERADEERRRNR